MIPTRIGESQRRILDHLKRHGPGSIPEIAERLGLSVETIRTHLKSLGGEGLVERRGRRRSGPGRPEILYGLTAASDVLFPNREGELLKDLTTFLDDNGRGDLVREFFDVQVERRRETVRAGIDRLGEDVRIEEVARVLSEEGFMAEVVADDEGQKLLRLCHCPIRSVVDVTSAPCRSEMRFIREVLGERLVRLTYIPSGDSACSYALKRSV